MLTLDVVGHLVRIIAITVPILVIGRSVLSFTGSRPKRTLLIIFSGLGTLALWIVLSYGLALEIFASMAYRTPQAATSTVDTRAMAVSLSYIFAGVVLIVALHKLNKFSQATADYASGRREMKRAVVSLCVASACFSAVFFVPIAAFAAALVFGGLAGYLQRRARMWSTALGWSSAVGLFVWLMWSANRQDWATNAALALGCFASFLYARALTMLASQPTPVETDSGVSPARS